MKELKQVITLCGAKGGIAKSTSALYLAEAMMRGNKHLRILIIDLDSQCNASSLLGWSNNGGKTVYDSLIDRNSLPVYPTNIKAGADDGGIFLCPGHPYLSSADRELQRRMQPKAVLRKCFARDIQNYSDANLPKDITEAFDYVIIDCPPALNDLIFNAMSVSDGIIIPVQTERLAIDAVSRMLAAYEEFRDEMKPDLKVFGILLTMVDERTRAAVALSEHIRSAFDEYVFSTRIRRCTKVVEAQSLGRSLYDYAPFCKTAFDYERLSFEFINITNNISNI